MWSTFPCTFVDWYWNVIWQRKKSHWHLPLSSEVFPDLQVRYYDDDFPFCRMVWYAGLIMWKCCRFLKRFYFDLFFSVLTLFICKLSLFMMLSGRQICLYSWSINDYTSVARNCCTCSWKIKKWQKKSFIFHLY